MLKPGYKQTDLGALPEEWEVKTLGELGEAIIGLTYSPRNIDPSGTLVLRSSNIQGGELDLVDQVRVKSSIPERIMVQDNDILICVRNGSRRLIGKSLLLDSRAKGFTFGAFMAVYRSPLNPFIFHAFNSDIVAKQIDTNLGATINSITNKDLNSYVIPLPPPAEQQAIADTLGTVDTLLREQRALLAKKRDLKQATQTSLLTRARRLPGFSGEWQERTIGELAEIVSGGTPSTAISKYWNGAIKWCTPTDITSCKSRTLFDTEKSITKLGLANSSASLLPVGALLLCSRATVGEIRIAGSPMSTNQGFKSLICKSGVSNEFLYYQLIQNKKTLIEKAYGSTFLEISKKDTASIILEIPSFDEQQAIAKIIGDMDAEEEVIVAQIAKTEALKQGLMQALLTGTIRLTGAAPSPTV